MDFLARTKFRNLVDVKLEGGSRISYKCNLCDRKDNCPMKMQKHLRYRCGVGSMHGGRKHKKGGSGIHSVPMWGISEEVEGAMIPTDILQRKVWEITGHYDPMMERIDMIRMLQDYAKRHRREIGSWEFARSLGDVEEAIAIGMRKPYVPDVGIQPRMSIGVGPGPEVGPSAGEMMKLRQELAECQEKLKECESRKGFAGVQKEVIKKKMGETSGELGELQNKVSKLEELRKKLIHEIHEQQEVLAESRVNSSDWYQNLLKVVISSNVSQEHKKNVKELVKAYKTDQIAQAEADKFRLEALLNWYKANMGGNGNELDNAMNILKSSIEKLKAKLGAEVVAGDITKIREIQKDLAEKLSIMGTTVDLEEKLRNAEAKEKECKDELENLRNKLKYSEQSAVKLRLSIGALAEGNAEKAIKSMEEATRQAQERAENAEKALRKCQEEIRQKTELVSNLEKDLNEKNRIIEELREVINQNNAKLSGLEQENEKIKQKLVLYETQLEKNKKALESQGNALKDLRTQLIEKTNELKSRDEEYEETLDRLGKLKDQAISNCKSEYETELNRLRGAEERKNKALEELAQQGARAKNLQNKLNEAKEKIIGLQVENKGKSAQLETLEKDVEEMKEQCNKLLIEDKTLKDQLSNARVVVSNMNKRIASIAGILRNVLGLQQTGGQGIMEELGELAKNLGEVENLVGLVKQKVDEAERSTKEAEEAKSKLKRVSRSSESERQKIDELLNDLTEKDAQIEKITREWNQLQGELDDLKELNRSLQEGHEREKEQLNLQIGTLLAENQGNKEELESLKQELEAYNRQTKRISDDAFGNATRALDNAIDMISSGSQASYSGSVNDVRDEVNDMISVGTPDPSRAKLLKDRFEKLDRIASQKGVEVGLRKQLGDLKAQVADWEIRGKMFLEATKELEKKKEEIAKLKAQLEEAQKQQTKAEGTRDSIDDAISNLGRQLSDLRGEESKTSQEAVDINKRISELEEEKANADRQVAEATGKTSALQNSLRGMEVDLDSANTRANEAERQLEELKNKVLSQKEAIEREREQNEKRIASELAKMADLQEENKKLEKDLEESRRNLEIAKQTPRDEGKIRELQGEKEDLEGQLREIQARLAEFEGAQSTYRDENEKLRIARNASESKAQEKNLELIRIRGKLESIQGKLRNAEEDSKNARNENESLRVQIKEKDDELNKLNTQIRKGLGKLNEEMQGLHRDRSTLRTQLEVAQRKQKYTDDALAKLRREFNAHAEKFGRTQGEKEELEREKERLKSGIQNNIRDAREALRIIDGSEGIREDLSGLLGEIKSKLNAVMSTRGMGISIKNTIDGLVSELQEKDQETGRLKEEISELQSQIGSLKGERSVEAERLRNEIEALKRAKEEAVAETATQKARADNLKFQLEDLRRQLSGVRGEKEDITRRLREAETTKEAVEIEMSQAQNKISRLEATNKSLQDNLKKAERENASANSRISELENRVRALQQELEAEKKRAKVSDDDCNEEWAKLQTEIKRVKDMMQSLEDEKGKLDNMLKTQPERKGRYEVLKGQFESYKNVPKNCADIKSFARIANATGAIQLIRTQKAFFDSLKKDLEAFGKRPNLGECIRRLEEIRDKASDTEKIGNTVENILETLRGMKAENNLDKVRLGFIHGKTKAGDISADEFNKWKNDMINKYGALDYNKVYMNVLNQIARQLGKREIGVVDYRDQRKRKEWRSGIFITVNTQVNKMKALMNKRDLNQLEIDEMKKYKDGICKSVESTQISFPENLREELRKLVNVYEDISGSVRVYARINTYFVENTNEGITSWIEKKSGTDDCTDKVIVKGQEYGPFFGVFMCATNKNVYQGITQAVPTNLCQKTNNSNLRAKSCIMSYDTSRGLGDTIRQVRDGYNIAIFGFGFSGSGKTFTLFGGGDTKGVVQEAFADSEIIKGLNNIEISEIKELYGMGSNSKNDYPGTGLGRVERQIGDKYYFRVFNDQVDTNTIIGQVEGSNVKYSDAFASSAGTLVIKNPQKYANIAVNFLVRRLELERKSIGRVKSTKNNPESSRAHLFITFNIGAGKLIIGDLGGIEYPSAIAQDYVSTKAEAEAIIKNTVSFDVFNGQNAIKSQRPTIEREQKEKANKLAREDIAQEINLQNIVDIRVMNKKISQEETLTKRLYEYVKNQGIRDMAGKVGIANVISNSSFLAFKNKYGLKQEDLLKDLVVMKIRYNEELLRKYLGNTAGFIEDLVNNDIDYKREVIREGYYINESLNQMKAYFLHKKNSKDFSAITENEQSMKAIEANGNDKYLNNTSAYNKDKWFYLPNKFTERGNRFFWDSGSNSQHQFENISRDDIGMLEVLRAIDEITSGKTKPSKFIMLALLRPDTIEVNPRTLTKTGKPDDRYLEGAVRALEFANSIASTT